MVSFPRGKYSNRTLVLTASGQWDSLTPAALADYGFDCTIYEILQLTPPTPEMKNALFDRYTEIVASLGTEVAEEELHKAFKENSLPKMLGQKFEWVRTTNEIC